MQPAVLRTRPRARGHHDGWQTLFYKEVLRFWKVSFQTVAAPVLTAVLYMLIFGHVLEDHVKVYGQVSYTAFLVPGLVMMSVLQNAFANSSSSLVQSKIMGNLVFLLLTPLSHWSWFWPTWALRWSAACWWAPACCWRPCFSPCPLLWRPGGSLVFAVLGAAMLGALGLIAGCGRTSSTRWRLSRTSSSCR
jgi:ABC-2 type transport system permease protein